MNTPAPGAAQTDPGSLVLPTGGKAAAAERAVTLPLATGGKPFRPLCLSPFHPFHPFCACHRW